MSDEKLYGCRDAYQLDTYGNGGHYSRHVYGMTREKLHSKSDIAAELALRDAQIEFLLGFINAIDTKLCEDASELLTGLEEDLTCTEGEM